MNRYFKVEGNIIYPDKQMLTWGPFYYHSIDKAKAKIPEIMEFITDWTKTQPTDIIEASGGKMVVFNIKALKTDTELQDCKGIINMYDIFFEDETE